MKSIVSFLMLVFTFQATVFAQNNLNETSKDNSVVMTWNKNTPEQEMKDDIKALRENNGVTIKYSNLKRNAKNEITSIKIEYSDRDGNSGSQEYKNKNAIPEIQFYKNNGDVGFGNPNNNQFENVMNFGNFGSFDLADLQKQLSGRIKIDTLGNNKSFSFNLNDDFEPKIAKKSKIIIQKDGKKPLVIEDGKVIEGESDYSKEEIEKIQNENNLFENKKPQQLGTDSDKPDLKQLQKQLDDMQKQIQKLQKNNDASKPAPSEMKTRKM